MNVEYNSIFYTRTCPVKDYLIGLSDKNFKFKMYVKFIFFLI